MRITLSILALTLLALTGHSARQFVTASSQYINSANFTGATAPPMTIAAYVFPNTTNAAQIICSVNSSFSDRIAIGLNSTGVANVNVNGSGLTSTTSGIPINTWTHIAGVLSAADNRVVYFNGVAETTNTTSLTSAGLDRVCIGMRLFSGTPGLFLNGQLAEVAIWNAALTQPEIAALAAGFKPSRVRPQNLVFYAPLYGVDSPEPNFIGTSATLTNAPTAAAHPRVY